MGCRKALGSRPTISNPSDCHVEAKYNCAGTTNEWLRRSVPKLFGAVSLPGNRRCGGALLLIFACALAPLVVRADDEVEAIRVEYSVVAECPSESEFLDRLRTHTRRFRIAGEGEPARTFAIAVDAAGHAKLTIRDVDGAQSERPLSGASCGEVVDGLALIAALAIDPAATIAPVASSASSSAPPPPPPPKPPPPPLVVRPAPSAGSRWAFSAGARVDMVAGISPRASFGAAVFLGIARLSESVFAPTLRLYAHGALPSSIAVDAASARFSRYGGSLEACPIRIGDAFAVRPCISIFAGAVRAVGNDIEAARGQNVAWLSSSLSLRFEAPLARWLRVELEPGLYHYRFEPATSIYTTPRLAAFGAINLAVLFL